MSVIIFLIALTVLVFVHELGHFLVAKWAGIRVDEFAIGFPPRLFSWQRGETRYSINLLPFGGFVKIFGENPDEASISGPDSTRSFVNKHRGLQAAVLVAGVAANVIFAWLLISISLMLGLTTSVGTYTSSQITNPSVMIVGVTDGSPASRAGLTPGDRITSIETFGLTERDLSVEAVQEAIVGAGGTAVTISFLRGSENKMVTVTPVSGIIDGKKGIGVVLDMVGTLKLPFGRAFIEGVKITSNLTVAVAKGLVGFIKNIFVGKADFSQVTGPVGLVGLVNDASRNGGSYLLTFIAFISINLAVINVAPFPALDGGRLLIVGIEAIRRKTISSRITNVLNGIGFALLILLMIVVTYRDILKLF